MGPARTLKPLWIAAAALLPALGVAEESPYGWQVDGELTSRVEYYEASGDERLSPYEHEGWQAFQELELSIAGQTRDHGQWEFDFAGLANASDYRAAESGLQAEYVRLRHENAAAGVPYRVDVGDQAAHFSRLSLYRTMRAGRIELQPGSGRADHSLVMLAGREEPDRYALHEPDETYRGASYLVSDPVLGDWSLNLVQHEEAALSGAEARHAVASLAAAWEMSVLRQQLETEAEWARQRGAVASPAGEEARLSGRAWHGAVRGEDRFLPVPVDYRLSYEDVGPEFQPGGTQLTRDTRSFQSRFGVKPLDATRLHTRYERYQSRARTLNPLTTREVGAGVHTALSVGPVTTEHELDVSHRARQNRQGSLATRTRRTQWEMGVPVAAGQRTRFGVVWLDLEDRAGERIDRTEQRFSLAHRSEFELGAFDVSAAPGVVYQRRDGYLARRTVNPTLELEAGDAVRRLGATLGYRQHDRRGRAGPDLDEYYFSLDWRYRLQRHTLGLEFDQQMTEPDPGDAAAAWRAGVFWRYRFLGQ